MILHRRRLLTATAGLAGASLLGGCDRFAGTDWVADDGAVFVHGATLWLSCTIHTEVPAGDHDIVLLHVHGIRADTTAAPLVFHGSRFRRLANV